MNDVNKKILQPYYDSKSQIKRNNNKTLTANFLLKSQNNPKNNLTNLNLDKNLLSTKNLNLKTQTNEKSINVTNSQNQTLQNFLNKSIKPSNVNEKIDKIKEKFIIQFEKGYKGSSTTSNVSCNSFLNPPESENKALTTHATLKTLTKNQSGNILSNLLERTVNNPQNNNIDIDSIKDYKSLSQEKNLITRSYKNKTAEKKTNNATSLHKPISIDTKFINYRVNEKRSEITSVLGENDKNFRLTHFKSYSNYNNKNSKPENNNSLKSFEEYCQSNHLK